MKRPTIASVFLTRNGFLIHHIDRGDTVEAAIAEHDPDLLLLDIMLPGKDGLSICRDLRPAFTRPIILLTSVAMAMLISGPLPVSSSPVRTRVGTVIDARSAVRSQATSLPEAPSSLGPCIGT